MPMDFKQAPTTIRRTFMIFKKLPHMPERNHLLSVAIWVQAAQTFCICFVIHFAVLRTTTAMPKPKEDTGQDGDEAPTTGVKMESEAPTTGQAHGMQPTPAPPPRDADNPTGPTHGENATGITMQILKQLGT